MLGTLKSRRSHRKAFRNTVFAAVTLIALAASLRDASGRQVEEWPYDKLFEKAELIVIAAPQATRNLPVQSGWQVPKHLVPQETTFTVLQALKGEVKNPPLKMFHFGVEPGMKLVRGSGWIAFRRNQSSFRTGQRSITAAVVPPPQYLLFLIAAGDRYEPVSGQVNPELSVKEIHAPLPLESAPDSSTDRLIVPGSRVGQYVIGVSTLAQILGSDTPEARQRFADQGLWFEFNRGHELSAVTTSNEQFATKEGLKVGSSIEQVQIALGGARPAERQTLVSGLLDYGGIQFVPKEERVRNSGVEK